MNRWLAVITGGSFAVLVFVAIAAPMRDVVLRFVHDDAFYYFEIARRLGSGQGSTFDGINPTNGYHPLWLLALLPLTALMNVSREAGARMAVVVCLLLMLGALVLLDRSARKIAPRRGGVAVLFCWAALSFATIYGMESALAALLLAAVLWLVARAGWPGTVTQGLVLGIASGLLVLSRLDCAVYVLVLDGLWLIDLAGMDPGLERRTGRWAWVGCMVIQSAIVLSYAAVNEVEYGHALPVSAMVKAGRHAGMTLDWTKSALAKLAAVGTCLGLISLLTVRPKSGSAALRVSAGGTLVYMGVVMLTGGRETYNWYFVPPLVCTGLFLSVVAERFGERQLGALSLHRWIVIGCVALVALTLHGRRRPSSFAEKYDRAAWIAAHVPSGAVFAGPDCGILGYFSEHSFVNTDGLTNSHAFQDAIHEDRVAQWLSETGVNAEVLKVDDSPQFMPDSTFMKPIAVRTSMYGEEPRVRLALAPWPGPGEGGNYTLWRISRIEPGRVMDRGVVEQSRPAAERERRLSHSR